MRPEVQNVERDAVLLDGIRAAITAAEAPALVDALSAYQAEAPTTLARMAEFEVRAMLEVLSAPLFEEAVREIRRRCAGLRQPTDIADLAGSACLLADEDNPLRWELLVDLELCLLHPETLRPRVRRAWLADVAAMRATGGWKVVRGAESECAALAGELADGERRALVRWLITLRHGLRQRDWRLSRVRDESLGGSLARRRLGWSVAEIAELCETVRTSLTADSGVTDGMELRYLLPAAERLSDAQVRTLLPALRALAQQLDQLPFPQTVVRVQDSAERRLNALILRAEAGSGVPSLPADFLSSTDGFATEVRAEFAGDLAEAGAAAFLAHCASLTSVRAAARWQRRCVELAVGYPQASATVERILKLVLQTRIVASDGDFPYVFLSPASSMFARGAAWAYAALAGSAAAPLLGDVAVRCGKKALALPGSMIDGVVANGAVAALASLDGQAAVEQLRRVQRMAEHRTFLKSVARAFDTVALRSGLTREQIIERGIPDHDLDAAGRHVLVLDDATAAAIAVDEEGTAGIEYRSGGKPVRSLPAAAREEHASAIKALKVRLKEVKETLRSERARIEAILATDRTWPAAEWSEYYLRHPLTGSIARRLIWEASAGPDGPWFAGLPELRESGPGGTRLRAADGTVRELSDSDRVRLWHPIRAATGAMEAWRAYLTDAETAVRQPFKQAFRELYRITPAEEATESYSNRFAGHILRYGQAKALTVERAWTGLSLGAWSEGISGEAAHECPGTAWRARFFLDTVSTSPDLFVAELCATDQVRFERRAGGQWQPASLAQVPAVLLSEAMRDVDLFVGVASIGADPQWADRGDERYHGYWREFGFGALPESAQARRATLARLLPRTRIADRVELTDRFLRVRGQLRTYKIHLGSGNVLMEPEEAYLCIVDARSPRDAARLFLPFEENGGVLSLIVSKAFLLADDQKITDPSISRQIRVG